MLDELAFYQYFYKLNDDLYHQRKLLEKRLKNNLYDFTAIDLLREINARIEQSKKIYDDLKGFYAINRELLERLNFD